MSVSLTRGERPFLPVAVTVTGGSARQTTHRQYANASVVLCLPWKLPGSHRTYLKYRLSSVGT